MIAAIENGTGLDINFNSHSEEFFYDMFVASQKNITPNQFREISSTDWQAIKRIEAVTSERLKLVQKQKEEEAKMKAEMQRRLN